MVTNLKRLQTYILKSWLIFATVCINIIYEALVKFNKTTNFVLIVKIQINCPKSSSGVKIFAQSTLRGLAVVVKAAEKVY